MKKVHLKTLADLQEWRAKYNIIKLYITKEANAFLYTLEMSSEFIYGPYDETITYEVGGKIFKYQGSIWGIDIFFETGEDEDLLVIGEGEVIKDEN